MFNKVILMGRLTRDPELRTAASGVTVCRFSIAVNRNSRQGDEQQTDFFNVTCFRQTAEFVSRWFSKGRPILVEGKVQNDNYTDNNGVKHYSVNIIADNVSFCGDKRSDNGGNGYNNGGGYNNNGGGYNNGYNNGGYQNNGGYNNGGGYPNGGNGGGYGNNGGYNNGGGYNNNGGYPNNGGGYQNNGGGYSNNGGGYNDNGFQMPQPPAPQQTAPPPQSQQGQPSDDKKTVELGNIGDFEEIISDGDVPF